MKFIGLDNEMCNGHTPFQATGPMPELILKDMIHINTFSEGGPRGRAVESAVS